MQKLSEAELLEKMFAAYNDAWEKNDGSFSSHKYRMTTALRVVQAQHEQEMEALKEKCLGPVTLEEERKFALHQISLGGSTGPLIPTLVLTRERASELIAARLAALAQKADPTLREQIGDAIAPYIGSSLDVDKAAQAVEELLERRKKGPAIS